MLTTLQTLGLIISIATSMIALIVTLTKPFKVWKKERKEREEERKSARETDKCLLRDRVLSIYYKHHKSCEIKQYEYENMALLYEQYKKLGGNSFVDRVWEEVQEWSITPQ